MNHLKNIASQLKEFGLDAMLILSEPGERYAVGFRGEGAVVVAGDRTFYLTDSRYIEAAGEKVSGAVILMTGRGSPQGKLLGGIINDCGIRKMGFEDEYMTVSAYKGYADALGCELVPASKLLSALRRSKGEDEIAAIERAQRIAEKALQEILGFIRPGLTEKEIAARLVYEMLRLGAEKPSFDTIVVSGPNSSLPHGVPGERRVVPGDFITMDFGCVIEGYCSDMTRTVVLGHADEDMKEIYSVVLEAQLAGIRAARGGIPGREIDAAARQVIEDAGYGEFFGHSFGHSLGLEIHESPNAAPGAESPMPMGAVISAEPGIYLPGRFGVRIEDMLVLEEDGCRNLTKAPKDLIIL